MKSNTNIHHLPYKLSLLAISLFIMMSAVISPALPLMMHAFPTISHVNIELLATIPNLGMIFGLLISPFLNRKWSPNWLEQRLHQFVFPLCLAFNAGGFFLISTARGALFSSAIFFTLLTIYGLFKSLKHTFIK